MLYFHLSKTGLLAILLLFFSITVTATHNRAGEVTYQKLGNYTYRVKIVTYTKTSSPADRPELEFWWGDGTRDTLLRNNIDFNVGPDIQRNTYTGTHVYPGNGAYIMYFLDENRNAGVVNIPGSVNIPFYVETQLIISPAFLINSSPQLLQPPIDNGAVNRIFIHNPNAYDPDGDSLSYELVECKGFGGQPIPSFFYPPGSNSFNLDPITGDLVWDSPMSQGEFNVAMIIREWRNISGIGMLNIGYVTRDMQITIGPPLNDPPVVTNINDTCLEAGQQLAFTVTATDPNPGETVTLTATGGPLTLSNSPATFSSIPGTGLATGGFSWNTTCAHVRKSPYSVVFKAEDNNQVQLADLESMFITVVGPAPENPSASPFANSMLLNWDQSLCTEAVGYHIYRRIQPSGFVPGYCETGVPAITGYSRISSVTGLGTVSYTDDDGGAGLAPAVEYCYMVTAFYPDGAESYASIEFCNRLKRDLPVITNVDVDFTGVSTGKINVAWSRPLAIDTAQLPGPYRYVLRRADGVSVNYSDIASFTDINDTVWADSGLNTSDIQYRYKVAFINETPGSTFEVGASRQASSIYLSVVPGDEKNRLSWNAQVPWVNTAYTVYRENAPGVFDSIGVISANEWLDDSLQNGIRYCYYVKSTGSYQDTGLVNPILNRSQVICATPLDNEPPCAPFLVNGPDCAGLRDTLSWNAPDSCSGDVAVFGVYFAPAGTGIYERVADLSAGTDQVVYTNENGIAGCYFITATDSAGNTGDSSNVVCTEGCPLYELPNVFTPDRDGINDLYHPLRPYRDVAGIEMTIHNRWGDIVYETEDIDINWNGRRGNDGEECPEGVYFYVCKVYEARIVKTEEPWVLRGFIHLVRDSKSNGR